MKLSEKIKSGDDLGKNYYWRMLLEDIETLEENNEKILDKEYLERQNLPLTEKIEKLKKLIELAEDWCEDQSNGMTDGMICISAMKDVRIIVNA